MQDMFNGETVAYETAKRPILQQVLNMLDRATAHVPCLAECTYIQINVDNISNG